MVRRTDVHYVERASRALKVNKKAFKHYVFLGKEQTKDFHYEPASPFFTRKPYGKIVHYLFRASSRGTLVEGLRVKEDKLPFPKFKIAEGGIVYFYGGYIPKLRLIEIHPYVTLKAYLTILSHEYVHAVENEALTKKFLLPGTIIPSSYYETTKLPELTLPPWYNQLLYYFVEGEQFSKTVELALKNPELLKAFFIFKGSNNDPLKLIEETFGWEDLFNIPLNKKRIDIYLKMLQGIKESAKDCPEEIQGPMSLFSV